MDPGFLLLRGTAAGCQYVRRLEPDVGVALWTAERPRAHRFFDHAEAEATRDEIVARESVAVAVVPA